MSAPSATQLCNRALHRIGERPIENLESDTTDVAQQCQLAYDDAVLELLVAHPWNFAVLRSGELAIKPDAPSFGFAYAYALPTDPACLRVIDTSLDVTWSGVCLWPPTPSSLWQVESLVPAGETVPVTVLVSDETPVLVRYIAAVTDPVRFSPQFRRALVSSLAATLAYSIATKGDLAADLRAEAKDALAWARRVDGQEGRPGSYQSRVLIDVRY